MHIQISQLSTSQAFSRCATAGHNPKIAASEVEAISLHFGDTDDATPLGSNRSSSNSFCYLYLLSQVASMKKKCRSQDPGKCGKQAAIISGRHARFSVSSQLQQGLKVNIIDKSRCRYRAAYELVDDMSIADHPGL